MKQQRLSLITSSQWQDYELLDSGNLRKLERFGPHRFIRPEPQAMWQPRTDRDLGLVLWDRPDVGLLELLLPPTTLVECTSTGSSHLIIACGRASPATSEAAESCPVRPATARVGGDAGRVVIIGCGIIGG